MDIRVGGSDPGLAQVKPDRRDHARDLGPSREMPPAVIVELGRQPESAGTYTARGTLDHVAGAPHGGDAAAPGAKIESQRVAARADASAPPTGSFDGPEAVAVQANAHVQALMGSSPEAAMALRPKLIANATNLTHPAPTMLAGVQSLATNALQQAEKGNAAAEHEDEADPLRKEKDLPARGAGKRRGP